MSTEHAADHAGPITQTSETTERMCSPFPPPGVTQGEMIVELRTAVAMLAFFAENAFEMSKYAASSRTNNTPEFVSGLFEEIQKVQDGYAAVVIQSPIAAAALAAVRKKVRS